MWAWWPCVIFGIFVVTRVYGGAAALHATSQFSVLPCFSFPIVAALSFPSSSVFFFSLQDAVPQLPLHTPPPASHLPPSAVCPGGAIASSRRGAARCKRGAFGGVLQWRMGHGVWWRGGSQPGQCGVPTAGLPTRLYMGAQCQVWPGTRYVQLMVFSF